MAGEHYAVTAGRHLKFLNQKVNFLNQKVNLQYVHSALFSPQRRLEEGTDDPPSPPTAKTVVRSLKSCGKFAAVTPPAMTQLLSTSLTSTAIASSGRRIVHSNNGYGNGGGSPNNTEDRDR